MRASTSQLRNLIGSVASATSSSQSAAASSSRLAAPSLRSLHSSPALDPKDAAADAHQPPPSSAAATESVLSGTQYANLEAQASSDAQVFLPLTHLHPTTRPPTRSLIPLSSHVFAQQPRKDILHSAVVYYLDSLRSGTASTKTRSEVNYSGRKIRQQKGSGMARLGTRGSPMLRGGGVAFGPKPRDFATDLPRRVRELALRSALSARWLEGKLHIVPSLFWDPPPGTTGPLSRALASRGWKENTLFLSAPRHPESPIKEGIRQRQGRPSAMDPVYTTEQREEHGKALANFSAALANLPRTQLVRLDLLTQEAQAAAKRGSDETKKPGELHAYEVVAKQNVVMDLGALEWLEEKLGGAGTHEDMALLGEMEGMSMEEAEIDEARAQAMEEVERAEGEVAAKSAP
ncbi:ribosomal protein L4 [Jaminaea rosea]|uniref:Large ribosomal subunit protein uL4m n=1 Tax=Jaminaea rosea TaxID=1569628 RepID=A0A316UV11_9BASI|nr:ribosomal protein L4 [Jaminaea rosea]PWN29140.1 ribosomal protein L4 [Jaminaea rosea]